MLFELSDDLLSNWTALSADPRWHEAHHWFLDLKESFTWEGVTYRGLTSHMLGLVAKYVQKGGSQKEFGDLLFPDLSDEVRRTWQMLCEKVLSWGCAFRPLAS